MSTISNKNLNTKEGKLNDTELIIELRNNIKFLKRIIEYSEKVINAQ